MWYPKPRTNPRNKYEASDGTKYTQRQIDRLRSEAYRQKHQDNPSLWCEGCGQLAQCNAHIIPQARLKHIHKTELIWHHKAFFNSCFKCNSAIENPKGEAWVKLHNIDECLEFIKLHDQELYAKFTFSRLANQPNI